MSEVNTCCFCGDECNPNSQSCGSCARRGTCAMLAGYRLKLADERTPDEPDVSKYIPGTYSHRHGALCSTRSGSDKSVSDLSVDKSGGKSKKLDD